MESLRIWLVAACVIGLGLPTWMEPRQPLGTLAGCGMVLLSWTLAAGVAAGLPWLLGRLRRSRSPSNSASRLPRGYLLGLDLLQLGLYAVLVLVFGWAELVNQTWGLAGWVLLPKLLILLPYVLGLSAVQVGLWPHVRDRVVRLGRPTSPNARGDCLPGEKSSTEAKSGADASAKVVADGAADALADGAANALADASAKVVADGAADALVEVSPTDESLHGGSAYPKLQPQLLNPRPQTPDPINQQPTTNNQTPAAPPPPPRLAWFLWLQFRQELAPLLAPLLAVMLMSDLLSWGYRHSVATVPSLQLIAPVLAFVPALLVMVVVGPLVIVRALPTRPLREGPLRDRLLTLAARVGFRSRPLRIWLTETGVVNALVIGVVPRFRYVLLSDGLVAQMSPAQIEAVFAHEMAHSRRGHLLLLAAGAISAALLASLLGGLAWLGAASALDAVLGDWSPMTSTAAEASGEEPLLPMWLDAIVSVSAAVLTLAGLSRRFEREADLTAAETLAEQRAVPLSESAELFCSALELAGRLSGVPDDQAGWWHDSVADRVAFLRRAAADSDFRRRFVWSLRLLKLAAILGAVVSVGLLLGEPAEL